MPPRYQVSPIGLTRVIREPPFHNALSCIRNRSSVVWPLSASGDDTTETTFLSKALLQWNRCLSDPTSPPNISSSALISRRAICWTGLWEGAVVVERGRESKARVRRATEDPWLPQTVCHFSVRVASSRSCRHP